MKRFSFLGKEFFIAIMVLIVSLFSIYGGQIKKATDTKSVKARQEVGKSDPVETVNNFYSYLDDSATEKAYSLMDPLMIKYGKSFWQEEFKNFISVKVTDIQEVSSRTTEKVFRVKLKTNMRYSKLRTGWQDGENERIVTVANKNGVWLISQIHLP